MCDACDLKNTRWKSWNEVPEPVFSASGSPWIDLSHRLTSDLSAILNYPRPTFEKWRKMPEYVSNITSMSMVAHHGTHLDAPNHFSSSTGHPSTRCPLTRLYGPGVVWSFDVEEYGLIDVLDIEKARPEVRPGDIVLFDTGCWKRIDDPSYTRHASLTPVAAVWLLEKGVKMIGVDFATPDLLPSNRPKPSIGRFITLCCRPAC